MIIKDFPGKVPFQNVEFIKNKLVDVFTVHFKTKVTEILNELNLKDNVYNGLSKAVTKNLNFLSELSIGNASKWKIQIAFTGFLR